MTPKASPSSSQTNRRRSWVSSCLRITGNQDHAADAAQETFFHLLKHARRITESLGGWLHRVAVRRSIDLVRRDAIRRRHESAFATAASAVETDQWADVSPVVDEAICELEEDLRDVLLCHYLLGQSTVHLAAVKGVSQPTISRRIEQALEMLRGGGAATIGFCNHPLVGRAASQPR